MREKNEYSKKNERINERVYCNSDFRKKGNKGVFHNFSDLQNWGCPTKWSLMSYVKQSFKEGILPLSRRYSQRVLSPTDREKNKTNRCVY